MLSARDPQHLPQQHGLGRDAVAQRREEAHVRRQVRAGREHVDHILPVGVGIRGLSAGHQPPRDLLVETLLRAQGRIGDLVVGDSKGPQIPHVGVEAREEVGTQVGSPHDHIPRKHPREDRAPHGVHKERRDQGQLILHHGLHREQLGELKQADVEDVVERGQSARRGHGWRDTGATLAARLLNTLFEGRAPLCFRRALLGAGPEQDEQADAHASKHKRKEYRTKNAAARLRHATRGTAGLEHHDRGATRHTGLI